MKKKRPSGPVRVGMIGGGIDAFIGPVHARALQFLGKGKVLAGAFSSNPDKSKLSAGIYGVDLSRAYGSWDEMFEKEKEREDGIEAVVIVTPNHLHVPAALAAFKAGLHVVTDKPLCHTYADALGFKEEAKGYLNKGQIFAITHQYLFFPSFIHLCKMVQDGKLGEILTVDAKYWQGWLSSPLEKSGQKQASWRTDPKQAGGGSIGDIGTHAFIQALVASGLKPTTAMSDLRSFVKGRKNDDNGFVMIICDNKDGNVARMTVSSSQIHHGWKNSLSLTIAGTKGSATWDIGRNEELVVRVQGKPDQVWHRGVDLHKAANAASFLPAEHPEGYNEAMASLYANVFSEICAARKNTIIANHPFPAPGLDIAMAGMQYIEAALRSHEGEGSWVSWPPSTSN
jgi:predicted dehydrogenase